MLFISVPILAERYERHTSFARKELAIMLKLTFFQVFNTVVAASAFLFDPTVAAHPRQWYSLGGALLANVTIGDAILIQTLLDFVQIPVLVNRLCIAPRAATQLQMDRSYAVPAGIYLAFRLQLAGKFVVLCTVFGSAIPTLYLVAAGYFWLAAWIDRYNLLRRLAPPPLTGAALTSAVALFVFPIAIGLHVIMALIFFAAIAKTDKDADTAGPQSRSVSPSPSAPGSTPNATAIGDAAVNATATAPPWLSTAPPSGSGGSYASIPSAMAPPAAPPLGSPSAALLALAGDWDAYHIQLITAALAFGVLLLFAAREVARAYGIRLRLLSDAQTNVVLKVITQEPDAEQAALVGATARLSAHGADVYLPPLAPPLLSHIGVGPAVRRDAVESVLHVVEENVEAERAASTLDRPLARTASPRPKTRDPKTSIHECRGSLGRQQTPERAPAMAGRAGPAGVQGWEGAPPLTGGSAPPIGGLEVARHISLARGRSFHHLQPPSVLRAHTTASRSPSPASPRRAAPLRASGSSATGTPLASSRAQGVAAAASMVSRRL